ncbi:uncharacterized protein [Amphiura filiformis]|uniref:uncharacterized protein n=1 Tax=Amphiura filiformis TaxID=82378 RepID=UPI003B20E991
MNSDKHTVYTPRYNIEPVLFCTANQTANTTLGNRTATIVWHDPTATDNSGDIPRVTCHPASGSDFVIGQTPVTCTASDRNGNKANCSFHVDVIDSEEPVLSCTANQIANTTLGNRTATVVWHDPTATDNSGDIPTVTCHPASGSDFVIGQTPVTCTASDRNGNKANCSFYVDVIDNEKPALQSCPANQIINVILGNQTATFEWNDPTATDNSGDIPTVNCHPPSRTEFTIGKTRVTCTASDRHVNTESCSFYVDVVIDICLDQLGMEDERIQDGQITVSSYINPDHSPYHARLGNALQWCAFNLNIYQWIQVELIAVMWIRGVMIQGRDGYDQWVTKFKVLYGFDALEWMYIQLPSNQTHMVFDGNTDQNTVVTKLFPSRVRATVIRIQPIEWQLHICMRFDLLGCEAPQDCYEILNTYGRTTSGIYWIYPIINGTSKPNHMQVWCDMDTDGGGWTVFQRRVDGSENFYLYWSDYKAGFGSLAVEHWLGNDNIYALVNNGKTYELRLDLYDGSEYAYDLYESFIITDEASDYTMTIGADIGGEAGDSFHFQNNQAFTTRDVDNDVSHNNCAQVTKGGWWYRNCHLANLNGLYRNGSYSSGYANGMDYKSWKGIRYSLTATEMKVRPAL